MNAKQLVSVAVLALSGCAAPMLTENLRATMQADNERFLAAWNTPNPAAFPAMYTKDAVLLPSGKPVGGPEAIRQFWEGFIKRGFRDHTYELVSVQADGQYAYQVARWTINVVKDTGEKTPLAGNTVRVYERQPDGRWLTKVHMLNRDQ